MAQKVSGRIKLLFGERIIAASNFRGEDAVRVTPENWLPVARALRGDPELAMELFVDLTAVDYFDRYPREPRFEVILIARSLSKNHLVRVTTAVRDGEELDSLVTVWRGADWAEREVYDMFGIRFRGHPNLRRVLLYDQFEGYPLRKDYPISKTQPIAPYREVEETGKIAPFGEDEGKVFSRINWPDRGRIFQASPDLSFQQGERLALSIEPDKQKE